MIILNLVIHQITRKEAPCVNTAVKIDSSRPDHLTKTLASLIRGEVAKKKPLYQYSEGNITILETGDGIDILTFLHDSFSVYGDFLVSSDCKKIVVVIDPSLVDFNESKEESKKKVKGKKRKMSGLRKNEKEKTDKRVGKSTMEKIDKSLLGHTIITIESDTSDSDTSDSGSGIPDQERKSKANNTIENYAGVDSKNQEESVSIIKEHGNIEKKMKESKKKISAKKVDSIKCCLCFKPGPFYSKAQRRKAEIGTLAKCIECIHPGICCCLCFKTGPFSTNQRKKAIIGKPAKCIKCITGIRQKESNSKERRKLLRKLALESKVDDIGSGSNSGGGDNEIITKSNDAAAAAAKLVILAAEESNRIKEKNREVYKEKMDMQKKEKKRKREGADGSAEGDTIGKEKAWENKAGDVTTATIIHSTNDKEETKSKTGAEQSLKTEITITPNTTCEKMVSTSSNNVLDQIKNLNSKERRNLLRKLALESKVDDIGDGGGDNDITTASNDAAAAAAKLVILAAEESNRISEKNRAVEKEKTDMQKKEKKRRQEGGDGSAEVDASRKEKGTTDVDNEAGKSTDSKPKMKKTRMKDPSYLPSGERAKQKEQKRTQQEAAERQKSGGREMTHCTLPLNPDGRSSGIATIRVATKEASEACIALKGTDVDARWLRIQKNKNMISEKLEGCALVRKIPSALASKSKVDDKALVNYKYSINPNINGPLFDKSYETLTEKPDISAIDRMNYAVKDHSIKPNMNGLNVDKSDDNLPQTSQIVTFARMSFTVKKSSVKCNKKSPLYDESDGTLPKGWRVKCVQRPNSRRVDRYWYTPAGKVLRSRIKVGIFLKSLELTNNKKAKALKLYRTEVARLKLDRRVRKRLKT